MLNIQAWQVVPDGSSISIAAIKTLSPMFKAKSKNVSLAGRSSGIQRINSLHATVDVGVCMFLKKQQKKQTLLLCKHALMY